MSDQRMPGMKGVKFLELASKLNPQSVRCLLYTSDAADERSSVDLGGRRIIKKKNQGAQCDGRLR